MEAETSRRYREQVVTGCPGQFPRHLKVINSGTKKVLSIPTLSHSKMPRKNLGSHGIVRRLLGISWGGGEYLYSRQFHIYSLKLIKKTSTHHCFKEVSPEELKTGTVSKVASRGRKKGTEQSCCFLK